MTVSRAEHLHRLVQELTADPAYATGRRVYPRSLERVDVLTISHKLHIAVEEGTEVRARKAAEDGLKIACAAGCNYCCEQLVMVWLPEAALVAEFLNRPDNAQARQRFLDAYPRWREQVGDAAEKVADATTRDDKDEVVRELLAFRRRWILCAFNQEGLCTVYEARPNICRTCHALDTNEHCRGDDDDRTAAGVKFEPLDRFMQRADAIHAAMHHAMGGRRSRTVALCQAVYEMLSAPEGASI